MTVESENLDKYFVTQITVLRETKLLNSDPKLQALPAGISPVSFEDPAPAPAPSRELPEMLPCNLLSRIFCQIW